MITTEEAEQIAARHIGAPASDPDNGWELAEFDQGWLILEYATRDLRGAGSLVVERGSGRVLHFASYIPPDRIVEEYDEVASKGVPIDPRPPPEPGSKPAAANQARRLDCPACPAVAG